MFGVDTGVLGLRYVQWIGLFVIIFLGVAIDFTIRLIVRIITRHYLRRDEDTRTNTDTPRLIRRAAKPFGIASGGLLVFLLISERFASTPKAR